MNVLAQPSSVHLDVTAGLCAPSWEKALDLNMCTKNSRKVKTTLIQVFSAVSYTQCFDDILCLMVVQQQGSRASEGFGYLYVVPGGPSQDSCFSFLQPGLGVMCQLTCRKIGNVWLGHFTDCLTLKMVSSGASRRWYLGTERGCGTILKSFTLYSQTPTVSETGDIREYIPAQSFTDLSSMKLSDLFSDLLDLVCLLRLPW